MLSQYLPYEGINQNAINAEQSITAINIYAKKRGQKYPVKIVWEKGHDGIELNEMADEWANRARKGETLDIAR